MGVPVSGAMDALSAEFGKALLDSDEKDALIEITLGQGKFQFTQPTVFCLTGGDFSPRLDGDDLKMNKAYKSKANAILSFGKRKYGARTYLAVEGGIQSEVILHSRSFSKGITSMRLEKGDKLSIPKLEMSLKEKFLKLRMDPEHCTSQELVSYPGPEYERLNEKQKQRLRELFTLSTNNNRVAYQINEPIENDLEPILTSAVLPGTVQLTPSGKLIVLMKDCQVTGGYPRVLQLSEQAISRLSQKVAGEKVRFCI
jgi:biotin-dependent carboxylase-like uncharacterized protein